MTEPAAPAQFRYLRVPQGQFADCSGLVLAEVLAVRCELDAAFLRAHPSTALYFSPCWSIHSSFEGRTERLPLGYERYRINNDGTLGPREANWDSGD